MQIQTTRFGAVTIEEGDLIILPEGLLGFNDLRKFVILEDPDDLVFAWLQSCEKPQVAFPILEPELFSSEYKVRLNKTDRELIKLPAVASGAPGAADSKSAAVSVVASAKTGDRSIRVFTIVTIPNDVTLMTANLKAPIILNIASRLAKQVVTQDNDHPIKHPIFNELQQRLFSGVTAGSATPGAPAHAPHGGVAVRVSCATNSRTLVP